MPHNYPRLLPIRQHLVSRAMKDVPAGVREAFRAEVRARDGEPFIVPAMGSHGGATDEGQAKLLDEVFGINERNMGCPVLSSMQVVELGRTPEHNLPVYV